MEEAARFSIKYPGVSWLYSIVSGSILPEPLLPGLKQIFFVNKLLKVLIKIALLQSPRDRLRIWNGLADMLYDPRTDYELLNNTISALLFV